MVCDSAFTIIGCTDARESSSTPPKLSWHGDCVTFTVDPLIVILPLPTPLPLLKIRSRGASDAAVHGQLSGRTSGIR